VLGAGVLAAAAVALLMVAPAVGGPVAAATKYLTAPYKGTTSNSYTNVTYTSCATSHAGSPKWLPSNGTANLLGSVKTKTCTSANGGGYGTVTQYLTINVPFRVGFNGTHLVRSNWTLTLGSTSAFTQGGCPAKIVNYNPPQYTSSSAGCSSGAHRTFQMYAQVVDLSGSSAFRSNGSSVYAWNDSSWSNYTSCYTYYSTPSCYNNTGGYSNGASYGYNAPGFASFTWNGKTTLRMWTNASYMVKTDRFVLEMSIYLTTSADSVGYNLVKFWPASATSVLDLASGGNGAKLDSLTIT